MANDDSSNQDLPVDQVFSASQPENLSAESSIDAEAILDLVESTQRNLEAIRQLLAGRGGSLTHRLKTRVAALSPVAAEEGTRIIEGVFDGQNMVGPDGKQYSVPANYASKSKLVEGDTMKLTITQDGSFIYKQIGPIERLRVMASLSKDEQTGEFQVATADRTYRVLTASVTYFKGDVGDEVVILVPAADGARWAAIENIIKKGSTDSELGL